MPNTARSATILEEEEEEVVVRACDSTRRIPRRMDKEFGRSPRSETKDGASRGKQKSYQPNSTVTKPPWMTGRPAAHGLDAYPEGLGVVRGYISEDLFAFAPFPFLLRRGRGAGGR